MMQLKEKAEFFYRKRVLSPIKQQLTQGVSIEKIALTLALSVSLGIFPILGSTSLVCLLVGGLLRLNLPFLLVTKSFFVGLHLALIMVFIRMGESLNRVEPITLGIDEMLAEFKESPSQFFQDFGLTAWYAIQAWFLVAIPLTVGLHFLFRWLLRNYATKFLSSTIAAP